MGVDVPVGNVTRAPSLNVMAFARAESTALPGNPGVAAPSDAAI
jgi:hypothetical protein